MNKNLEGPEAGSPSGIESAERRPSSRYPSYRGRRQGQRPGSRNSLAFWFGALGLTFTIAPIAWLWWTVFDWIGPSRGKMMHPHNYRVFAVVGLMVATALGMQAWWNWGPYLAAWPARRRWMWAALCWAAPLIGVSLVMWFRAHPHP